MKEITRDLDMKDFKRKILRGYVAITGVTKKA